MRQEAGVARANVGRRVVRPMPVFCDRDEAGAVLAGFVKRAPSEEALVLALPRGGIPVGRPLAAALRAPLQPVFVRKLPLPSSPEMGFGALAIDGSMVLNHAVVRAFGIAEGTVRSVARQVQREIERRAYVYGNGALPNVAGKIVYMVDDGLATGYTAMAAAKMVKAGMPSSVSLCVPVSPADSLVAVEAFFDEVYCLIAQDRPPFAVASFYRDFHDLSDKEVLEILRGSRE
jgi:putative phosphoribosyl transferase